MTSPEDVSRAQQALLRDALARRRDADVPREDARWAGEASLAPFAPTEPRRARIALRALRVREDDVLYDLGSGDGRVLVAAALEIGCRCVGLELDDELRARATALAESAGVGRLCEFHACDLSQIHPRELASGFAGAAAPTACFAWLTGSGLSRFSRRLRAAWEHGAFRIATCVDSLDSCVDYERDGAFAEHADVGWRVHRGAAAEFGVFVVPPRGVSLERWAEDEDESDVLAPEPEIETE